MERIRDLATPVILRNHHLSSLLSSIFCRTMCMTGSWVTHSSGKFKCSISAGATASDGSKATGGQGCWIIKCLTMRASEPAGNAKGASSSLPCCLPEYPAIPQWRTTAIFLLANYSQGLCLEVGAMCVEVLGRLGYALLVWLGGVERISLALEL